MSHLMKLFQRSLQYLSWRNAALLVGWGLMMFLLVFLPGEAQSPFVTSNALVPPTDSLLTVAQQEDGEDSLDTERGVVALVEVVVAEVDIPVGERLRPELMSVQQRPSDNVAIRAGVTFSDINLLSGQVAKTTISAGQAILAPMIAVSSTDLANIGSDLALFVDNQEVAVAFPISRYSGVSYAMRPGDLVDVLMSFNMIELDIEFQTALPNRIGLVDEVALESGQPFLFPATSRGRLEVIPELNNTIVQITPQISFGDILSESPDAGAGGEGAGTGQLPLSLSQQQPRRVTQLTVQQAEVLWIGTWEDPFLGVLKPIEDPGLSNLLQDEGGLFGETVTDTVDIPTIDPAIFEIYRSSIQPDVVILSMPVQEALVMKWALEEPGTDVDLALRSQGDNALYFTTSVSLPQLVEQAGLSIPEPAQFDLQPRIDGSSIPRLPAVNPQLNVVEPEENPEGEN